MMVLPLKENNRLLADPPDANPGPLSASAENQSV
jgi:hypothetical protein